MVLSCAANPVLRPRAAQDATRRGRGSWLNGRSKPVDIFLFAASMWCRVGRRHPMVRGATDVQRPALPLASRTNFRFCALFDQCGPRHQCSLLRSCDQIHLAPRCTGRPSATGAVLSAEQTRRGAVGRHGCESPCEGSDVLREFAICFTPTPGFLLDRAR